MKSKKTRSKKKVTKRKNPLTLTPEHLKYWAYVNLLKYNDVRNAADDAAEYFSVYQEPNMRGTLYLTFFNLFYYWLEKWETYVIKNNIPKGKLLYEWRDFILGDSFPKPSLYQVRNESFWRTIERGTQLHRPDLSDERKGEETFNNLQRWFASTR